MNQTLVGVFDGPEHAEIARDELIQAGFAQGAVQLQQDGSGSPAGEHHEWGMGTTGQHRSGGIGGFLRSLFGFDDNDDDVRVYSEAARRGKCILTVDVDNDTELERAHEIIDRHHPIDIDEHAAQWRKEGWSDAAATSGTATAMRDSGTSGLQQEDDEISPAPMTGSTMAGSAGMGASAFGGSEAQRVPVVQEELQVGKRTVRAGGLRVYSRLRETPVEEQVQLREERAHVERRATDRPATEADFNQLRDGSIEVRETIEEPVVSKQARVVEEVEVGKDVRERTETVRDTVRHTEVEVEQLGEHATASAAGENRSSTSTRPGSTRDEDLSTKAARATDKVENAIERGVDKVTGRSSKRK